jgi:glycosyltransferase involved in cell wall biosynthesis
MRIAFIGQKGIPTRAGGVEKHVEEMAVRMAKAGHDVFVYVRNNYTDQKLSEYRGVNLIHLPSIGTKNLDAISHTFLASVHALFQKYDVVHYQAIGPSSLAWITKWFNRRAVLVSTFHCQDYFHQKWGWFAQKYLQLGEYVSCMLPERTIVVSKSLVKYVKDKYQKDVEFIPNGAAVHFNDGNKVLERWGLRDKKYILNQGRLIRHKGVQYLIEAFKKLEDTAKVPNNFKLVIVGDGFHTDEYVQYLHKISEGRKSIVFTGIQNNGSMEQLFSHAYAFVQPSESEGLSISLLEAMGYGLCPLVSNIPENLEATKGIGFSFRSKDADDLGEKLAYILNQPLEVEEAGKNAKTMVEREYSWDSIVEKTLNLYEELMLKKNAKLLLGKFKK